MSENVRRGFDIHDVIKPEFYDHAFANLTPSQLEGLKIDRDQRIKNEAIIAEFGTEDGPPSQCTTCGRQFLSDNFSRIHCCGVCHSVPLITVEIHVN